MENLILQNKILNVSMNHYDYLISLQNVLGVGVGFKHIKGIQTNELCLHVLVSKKLPCNCICNNNLIPLTYMGLKTDVIEVGDIFLRSLTDRIRPLQAGCSIGPALKPTFSGTLGCIVFKEDYHKNKTFFALSNNHIFAGDNAFPKKTTVIVQPAAKYGGTPVKDTIGTLYDFIPIKFTNPFKKNENYVDCALAKLSSPSLASSKIAQLGKNINGITPPSVGLKVKKIGSSTGLTDGEIETIGATFKLPFGKLKSAIFKDQILSTTINYFGDSGSVLLDKQNNIVGLNFAGSNTQCISNDIRTVLRLLNVNLYTS